MYFEILILNEKVSLKFFSYIYFIYIEVLEVNQLVIDDKSLTVMKYMSYIYSLHDKKLSNS